MRFRAAVVVVAAQSKAEVTGGFTGRMLALAATTGSARVLSMTYVPAR